MNSIKDEKILDICGLCKSFGDIKAVNDISFCVKKASFLLFLA